MAIFMGEGGEEEGRGGVEKERKGSRSHPFSDTVNCLRKLLLSGSSLSLSGGDGSTCHLDSCDDSALSVEDLEVVVVEATDLDNLTETEVGDVDLEDVREVSRKTLDVELTHLDLELTAGLNAFAVTDDLERHTDGDWFVVEDLLEVDVEDVARDWVELDVLEDSLLGSAIDVEVDDVDVRGVD